MVKIHHGPVSSASNAKISSYYFFWLTEEKCKSSQIGKETFQMAYYSINLISHQLTFYFQKLMINLISKKSLPSQPRRRVLEIILLVLSKGIRIVFNGVVVGSFELEICKAVVEAQGIQRSLRIYSKLFLPIFRSQEPSFCCRIIKARFT